MADRICPLLDKRYVGKISEKAMLPEEKYFRRKSEQIVNVNN
ncbi:hypothetical protein C942_03348 [Photobacterium marinum]|uniref:Uncharacterized protein n=1 Tax=Photobacterium marinum TaxID=1056511 RepID=L8J7Z5_9GAMM|nr:hypothetical protein C942_03348 [Photobacterium marinum]